MKTTNTMEYRDILLCSEDLIKTYSNISDNIAGDYLLPAIHIAQRTDLEGIIGTALVKKIQCLIGDEEIHLPENGFYKELLDEYITDFLCYASIKELITIVSFKINNVGAARTAEEKTSLVTFSEVFKLKDYYEDKADYFAMRMQKYIAANYNKFPELNDTDLANIKANIDSAASCSIFLGGARSRRIKGGL